MSTAAPGLPLPTASDIFASGSAPTGFAAGFGAAAAGSGSGSEPQAASARPAIETKMTKRFILIMPLECAGLGSVAHELYGHATRLRIGDEDQLDVVVLDDYSPRG